MKTFKRNAVIITVLLFVCAAVYLNWSYNEKVDDAQTAGENLENQVQETTGTEDSGNTATEDQTQQEAQQDGNDAGLYYTGEGDTEETITGSSDIQEYFAQVRLERQQARDEASSTLETVATSDGASQETIDEALEKMTKIADWTAKEAELENLIMAKGFEDCVVYLSDSGASVTVAAGSGLTNSDVAKITDVIVSETEFTADQLKVIEIK